MTHTREPWTIKTTDVPGVYELEDFPGKGAWAPNDLDPQSAIAVRQEDDDNAARLQACANACAGIPTAHLKMMKTGALIGEGDRIATILTDHSEEPRPGFVLARVGGDAAWADIQLFDATGLLLAEMNAEYYEGQAAIRAWGPDDVGGDPTFELKFDPSEVDFTGEGA